MLFVFIISSSVICSIELFNSIFVHFCTFNSKLKKVNNKIYESKVLHHILHPFRLRNGLQYVRSHHPIHGRIKSPTRIRLHLRIYLQRNRLPHLRLRAKRFPLAVQSHQTYNDQLHCEWNLLCTFLLFLPKSLHLFDHLYNYVFGKWFNVNVN